MLKNKWKEDFKTLYAILMDRKSIIEKLLNELNDEDKKTEEAGLFYIERLDYDDILEIMKQMAKSHGVEL